MIRSSSNRRFVILILCLVGLVFGAVVVNRRARAVTVGALYSPDQSQTPSPASIDESLGQIQAQVNRLLEESSGLASQDQTETTGRRRQLLSQLSLMKAQLQALKLTAGDLQRYLNRVTEMEEKLFTSADLISKRLTKQRADLSPEPENPRKLLSSANIQPAANGMVTGKVTDTGAQPIAGITVFVVTAQGGGFGGITDSQGNYTVSTAPGTYYVVTNNDQGYLDQLYDGQPCLALSCLDNPSNGTQVTVTSGATTPNINFTLKKGGALTGKIIDAVTLAPLVNLQVGVYDANGLFLEEFTADSSGIYMTSGLPPGIYYAHAFGHNAYISQTYNGINCSGEFCNAAAGTPIAVNTSTVPNINFALQKGGTITGVITDAVTAAPIPSINLAIVDSAGNTIELLSSNASGVYTSIEGLTAGTYYVQTFQNSTYLSQLYNGIQCGTISGCIITNGTPVTVTPGSTTAGINFPLVKGGLISGKVTDAANTPLANVEVDIYDANGTLASFAGTDASGNYTLGFSLAAGTYFARTVNSGFIDQLYNGIVCNGDCDVTAGTPISVALGSTTGNINFSLSAGGSISGRVLDTANNSPVPTNVNAYDSKGNFAGSGKTSNSGFYTIVGLPAGTYYVRTNNTASYIDQLYTGIQCAFQNCIPTTGTPVSVSAETTTPNINFALQKGGKISGTVINTANSLGILGVTVRIYDGNGTFVISANSQTGGIYLTSTGLPTGVYFARTSNDLGYLDQLYSGRSCALGCSPATGTPINVTAGTTTPNINFSLQKGGTISGQVTDANTHGALSNIFVDIYDSSGTFITNGVTDGAGNYKTFDGLPTGNYYALTSNSQNYIESLFNGVQCPFNCDPTTGTAITVTAATNTANVNFALTKGGSISGKVTDTGNAALGSITVSIYDSGGNLVDTRITNGVGTFTTDTGLPAGAYFARTSNSLGYINQLFSGIQCLGPSCLPTGGTPITVTLGANTSNVNFALQKGGSITGKVTNSANAQPLSGVNVRIFDSNGTFMTSALTDGSGVYLSSLGLPTGVYFARTTNSLGFIDQLFQGAQCLGCTVTTGTPIPVVIGSTTTAINFSLLKGGTISGKVIDASNSTPVPDVTVTIVDSTGHSVSSGTTDGSGNYLTGSGLPTGAYFAVTFNESGYLDELYNGIPCPAGCDPTSGNSIAVTSGANTPNVNFSLPKAGASTQFSTSTYNVSESSSSIDITVERLGDLNGTVTVDFASTDGTALQRSDYTATSGTLTFLTGEAVKTFPLLITKDALSESTETINLTLSNPTGSTVLGSPKTAILNITNDGTVPNTPNPIDDARTFVLQHYHDFLNRDPDNPGLVFWTSQITNCGSDANCVAVTRINTSAAFFFSIEFQETGGFAIRAQRAAFGKKSIDPATRIKYSQFIHDGQLLGNGIVVGQPGWEAKLEANKQAYINQTVTSTAFTTAYAAGLTADQFVDALFASAGVVPASAERQAAITAFAGGGNAGRAAALRSVSDSNSLRTAEFSPSFVLMQYFGYLRRNPTDAPDNNDNGYQFWLTKLNSFNGDFNKAEMVKAFITSFEYRSRFGQP